MLTGMREGMKGDTVKEQPDFAQKAMAAKQEADAAKKTFLTGPQVRARYQKSHVTIWRWVRDPALGFPQPIQINRLNYWRLSDLEAWEAAQEMQGAA